MLDAVWLEVRYTVRSLRRTPGFVLVIVLTLALGVGANGAVYSALDRFLIGLPDGVKEPELVKRVQYRYRSPFTHSIEVRDAFTLPEVDAMRLATLSAQIAGFAQARTTFGDAENVREARVDYIVGDYFGLLGVAPAQGRLLHQRDIDGAAMVAVINHDLWVGRFAGRSPIEGTPLVIGGQPFVIVGVASPGFRGVGLGATQAWVPYGVVGGPLYDWGKTATSVSPVLSVLARVSATEPFTSLSNAINRALVQVPSLVRDTTGTVLIESLSKKLGARSHMERVTLIGLPGATVATLVIGCLNAAILILVRSARRRRDTAVRFALGISPGRMLLQVGIEAAVLAMPTIAVGLLVSVWTGAILRDQLVPGALWGSSPLNGRVAAVIIMSGMIAAATAASLPAYVALRSQITEGLRGTMAKHSSLGKHFRQALLALQAALAVVFLAAAVAFTQNLRTLLAIPTGYRAREVLVVQAPLAVAAATAEREATMEDLLRSARAIPGVERVGLSTLAPGIGSGFVPIFTPAGDTVPTLSGHHTTVTGISPEYLDAVGTQIVRGRGFTREDRAGMQPVMLVSHLAARLYWPADNAIGKCLRLLQRVGPCRVVVGVVDDTRMRTLDARDVGLYIPLSQSPSLLGVPGALVVRATPGHSVSVASALTRTIAALPQRSAWSVHRLADLLTQQLRPHRLNAGIFSTLALLALIVAGVGIYGTASYIASELTRDIGVRRALGAGSFDVAGLLLRQAVTPVLLGAALGMAATVALRGLSKKLILGAPPGDPSVLAIVALALLLMTTVACTGPLLRSLRVSPLRALSTE